MSTDLSGTIVQLFMTELRENRDLEGRHRFYRFRTPLRGRTHRFYWDDRYMSVTYVTYVGYCVHRLLRASVTACVGYCVHRLLRACIGDCVRRGNIRKAPAGNSRKKRGATDLLSRARFGSSRTSLHSEAPLSAFLWPSAAVHAPFLSQNLKKSTHHFYS